MRPLVFKAAGAAFKMSEKHRRNGAYISGERTPLASSFRRARRDVHLSAVHGQEEKFAMARPPSPAREARALPRITREEVDSVAGAPTRTRSPLRG